MKLENGRIRVEFCEKSGAVVLLFDKALSTEFLKKAYPVPFEAEFGDGFKCEYTAFEVLESDDTTIKMKWTLREGCDLYGEVFLLEDGVSFTSHVEETELPLPGEAEDSHECATPYVRLIKYPVLGGFDRIADGGNHWLYHSFATGVLIQNPAENFTKNNYGMQHMPYPESFSGSAMQFMAYYGDNGGGLYMASHDGDFHHKWLNFAYPEDTDHKPVTDRGLVFSHAYGYQDMDNPGLTAPYPVVIRLLPDGGDWYDAADFYKEWALQQVWCRRGKYSERKEEDLPLWLLDETGVSTFGINGRHDRTLWLNKYKEYIHTPIFHISGPDWPKHNQDYYNHLCGGWDDWFPTEYNQANIDCMRGYGDHFAPFEFDIAVNMHGADSDKLQAAWHRFPKKTYSIDTYRFRMPCPGDPYTQEYHVSRDVEILRQTTADALYYDISASNQMHCCVNPAHRHLHTMGGDCEISRDYRKIFKDTHDAANKTFGKYIPMGTEMISEAFLDILDYYQARAWAQPASALETWNMRELLLKGAMKMVPAFDYVYHDYGAIRLDGWGKMLKEIGDLFYHTVAKTYLWGGIYELNYEYSPMEVVDGVENKSSEHYFHFNPRGYKLDEERAHYVGKYARLRVDKTAGKYLARGRMLHPLKVEIPYVDYTFYHYNIGGGGEYNSGGIYSETALIHSAWRLEGTGDALFFANTTAEDRVITVPVEKDRADGLFANGRSARIFEFGVDPTPNSFEIPENGEFTLKIPAKSCIVIEILE